MRDAVSAGAAPLTAYVTHAVLKQRLISRRIEELAGSIVPEEHDCYVSIYGEQGARGFWHAWLSQPTTTGGFAQVLAVTGAATWNEIDERKARIERALIDAHIMGETWIRDPKRRLEGVTYLWELRALRGPDDVKVVCQPAVMWLLGNPLFHDLVPQSLKAFLNLEAPGTLIAALPATSKKPQPTSDSEQPSGSLKTLLASEKVRRRQVGINNPITLREAREFLKRNYVVTTRKATQAELKNLYPDTIKRGRPRIVDGRGE